MPDCEAWTQRAQGRARPADLHRHRRRDQRPGRPVRRTN